MTAVGPADITVSENPRSRKSPHVVRPPLWNSPIPKRLTIIGLALTMLVLAALWLRPEGKLTEPPLLRPLTTYTTYPLDPEQARFSLGAIYIRDPGAEVEILEVKPLHSANVDYLGAFAVWPSDLPDGGFAGSSGEGFPSPEQRRHHPAFGVVVPAEEFDHIPKGWDRPAPLTVTAGFRIREGTRGAMNGLLLVYRVGDRVVREHVRQAMIACVEPLKDCSPDEPADGSDASNSYLSDLGLIKD